MMNGLSVNVCEVLINVRVGCLMLNEREKQPICREFSCLKPLSDVPERFRVDPEELQSCQQREIQHPGAGRTAG